MKTKTGTEIDRETDQIYQNVTDRLIENMLIWKISADEETKAQEDIVTISSEDSESDGEARARCKCNKGHKNRRQIMACIAKEDCENDIEDWGDYVKELGKAVVRDKVSNRTLATAFRMGAQEIGERKDNPADYPSFKGAALRPEAQECHQGDLYHEALRQARREGPPLYTFIYDADQDSWYKYLTNPQDIIKSLINQIDRNAEREAMKAKIYIIQSLTRAFGEITHREEVARKGFARGKNINMYDAGEKVGRMVLKRMRKWKEERDHYEALFRAGKH